MFDMFKGMAKMASIYMNETKMASIDIDEDDDDEMLEDDMDEDEEDENFD